MKPVVMRFALVALTAAILVGCTQEATTRKEQVDAFIRTFGFSPSSDVTNISYHNTSAWAPNLGGYRSLIRFTYVSNVVNQIEKSYGLSLTHAGFGSVDKPPEWWQEPASGEKIYYGVTNGIMRCMWFDENRRYVYYLEANVD